MEYLRQLDAAPSVQMQPIVEHAFCMPSKAEIDEKRHPDSRIDTMDMDEAVSERAGECTFHVAKYA